MRGIDLSSLLAALSLAALGCNGRLSSSGPGANEHPTTTGPAPAHAVLFDTPEADAILARLAVFPADNPWNQTIVQRPVAAGSSAMIASIGEGSALASNRDMNFVLVPSSQPPVVVDVHAYADQSDPGPFPIPENAPIEGWPLADGSAGSDPAASLAAIQRDGGGDRHLIVVDPAGGRLVELLEARRGDLGWQAAQSSVFNLASNQLRPKDWTSADAAGLPIFPAIVRYDDVASGLVRHAMRFTAPSTRDAYVYPARHSAGASDDPALPRMGERLRLRLDFDTTGFPPHARAILEGLKIYGMMLADNGMPWRISVAPDQRIEGLESLSQVHGSDFEVLVAESGPGF